MTINNLEMVMLLPLARGFKTIPDWWDLPARTRFRWEGYLRGTYCAHRPQRDPAEEDSFASPFL